MRSNEPNEIASTSITADLPNIRVRFEPEVLEALQRNAAKNERSVASEVRWIVKQHLEREAAK